MEIKVVDIGTKEEQSLRERERALVEGAASQQPVEKKPEEKPAELTDESFLSFFNEQYKDKLGRTVESLEELVAAKPQTELPEDLQALLDYRKETGRGIEDFMKLQRDYSELDDDSLLKEYYMATEPGLDRDDVDTMLEDFEYDDDIDEESQVKRKKLAKKKEISKARSYFADQQERFKQPTESGGERVSDDEREERERYKEYYQNSQTQAEEIKKRRDWFLKKTDEVFADGFKGFEFEVGGNSVTYAPGSAKDLKAIQSDPAQFMGKYVDEDGLVTDAAGYHRMLSVAMNVDKFAEFFYEQGKSAATEDVLRKQKNIRMSERRAPEVGKQGGTQIRAVSSPDDGTRLRIRSPKNR